MRPLAQVAPSMYKGRLLLWLRALSAQSAQSARGKTGEFAAETTVRLRLFHSGHGLMHDMGSIDPPLVFLVRAGAWFAVFGKSTKPCILMAGTWNKSQKHMPPVASTQSSLDSFLFLLTFVDFHVQFLILQFLLCKECLRGKRAHQFSKSHLENDFQTISVVHSEIANAMSEPNYCTCDSV